MQNNLNSSDSSRILLVCDRPNWAYDAIAKALIRYNTDPSIRFEVAYIKGGEYPLEKLVKDGELVFVIGWQLVGDLKAGSFGDRLPFLDTRTVDNLLPYLDPQHVLTGIHSHHAWDNKKSQPDRHELPPRGLVKFLNQFPGVNAVSWRLYNIFKNSGLRNIHYTPNGVDADLFMPEQNINLEGPLRAGFSGNKKHDWRKGISNYIEPACDLPGVDLRLAMPQDGHYVPLADMPQFYNEIDLYICASSSEGFSLSVLEAAACGRPIISTRVGGSEELIEDGVNGFLVDRDAQAIREKLKFLLNNRQAVRDMGAANREIVLGKWSWEKRAPDWIEFLRKVRESVS